MGLTEMKVHHDRSWASNRFMEKGVELQIRAINWHAVVQNYEYSCMLCCTRNIGATDCATCPIRQAMLNNADRMWKSIPSEDYKWIEEERRLL